MKVSMVEVPPEPVKSKYVITLELTEMERFYLSCLTNPQARKASTEFVFGHDEKAARQGSALFAEINRVVGK